jgi:hypothetical protein
MSEYAIADHLAIQYIESRKNAGNPMAFVFMGHAPATPSPYPVDSDKPHPNH